jgi:hypothetical protein
VNTGFRFFDTYDFYLDAKAGIAGVRAKRPR